MWRSLWLLACCCLVAAAQSVDRTAVQGAVGEDVVLATERRVEAAEIWVNHDWKFFYTLSSVETGHGSSESPGSGGLYGLSEDTFISTQDYERTSGVSDQLQALLGTAWDEVSYDQLDVPIFSSIAAHLVAAAADESFPQAPASQADFWAQQYGGSDTEAWLAAAAGAAECTRKLDIVFLVEDCNGEDDNYQAGLSLASTIQSLFSSPEARTAVVKFCNYTTPISLFDGTSAAEHDVNYNSPTGYLSPSPGANVGYGILWVVDNLFTDKVMPDPLFGPRPLSEGAARVTVVVTSSGPLNQQVFEAVGASSYYGVTVMAIGIGGNATAVVTAIGGVAAPDGLDLEGARSYMVSNAGELGSLAGLLQLELCRNVPLHFSTECVYEQSVAAVGGSALYSTSVPAEGLTAAITDDSGSSTCYISTTNYPNAALYSQVVSSSGNLTVSATAAGAKAYISCESSSGSTLQLCTVPGESSTPSQPTPPPTPIATPESPPPKSAPPENPAPGNPPLESPPPENPGTPVAVAPVTAPPSPDVLPPPGVLLPPLPPPYLGPLTPSGAPAPVPPAPPPVVVVDSPLPGTNVTVDGTSAQVFVSQNATVSIIVNLPVPGVCNVSSFQSTDNALSIQVTSSAPANVATTFYVVQLTISGSDPIGIEIPPGACTTVGGDTSIDVAPIIIIHDNAPPAPIIYTTSPQTENNIIGLLIEFGEQVVPDLTVDNIVLSASNIISTSLIRLDPSSFAMAIVLAEEEQTLGAYLPVGIVTDLSGLPNTQSNRVFVNYYTPSATASNLGWGISAAVWATTAVTAGSFVMTAMSNMASGLPMDAGSSTMPASALAYLYYHVQVFAAMHDLAARLPSEYRTFSSRLLWSNFRVVLPWDAGKESASLSAPSPPPARRMSRRLLETVDTVFQQADTGLKSLADSAFSLTTNVGREQSAEQRIQQLFGDAQRLGWKEFAQIVFWVAVVTILLVALHVAFIKFCKHVAKWRPWGFIQFPRLEIFLFTISVLGISQACAFLITVHTVGSIILGVIILVAFPVCFAAFSTYWLHFRLIKRPAVRFVLENRTRARGWRRFCSPLIGRKVHGEWKVVERSIVPHDDWVERWGLYFEDYIGPVVASDEVQHHHLLRQRIMNNIRVAYMVMTIWQRVAVGVILGAFARYGSNNNFLQVGLLAGISVFQASFLIILRPFVDFVMETFEAMAVVCQIGAYICIILTMRADDLGLSVDALGVAMMVLASVGILVQLLNQWYLLYLNFHTFAPTAARQVRQMPPLWQKAKKAMLAGELANSPSPSPSVAAASGQDVNKPQDKLDFAVVISEAMKADLRHTFDPARDIPNRKVLKVVTEGPSRQSSAPSTLLAKALSNRPSLAASYTPILDEHTLHQVVREK